MSCVWLANTATRNGGSSMSDPLHQFLIQVDDCAPVFTEATVRTWPGDAFERLRALGLIQTGAAANVASCPACSDGHEEEVVQIRQSNGKLGLFIHCPTNLRVPIEPDSLRQWTIDVERLVQLLSRALCTSGQLQNKNPGLLWRLGKVDWQSAKRETLFARCLDGSESASLQARIESYAQPILFVAHETPADEFWKKHRTAVISLSHVAKLGLHGLEIDAVELHSMVVESDKAMREAESRLLSRESLERVVRRQVKAEAQTELTDDDILRAYRANSSVRKVAAELSQSRGVLVSKDRVQGALSRAGGARAVLNSTNSSSIIRSVASQHRDIHGKPIRSTQPKSQE